MVDVALHLPSGHVALIDKEDLPRVTEYSWFAVPDGRRPWQPPRVRGEKWTGGKCQRVYLHRFLAEAPAGLFVGHINGNPLDNRRSNLRLCAGDPGDWEVKPRHVPTLAEAFWARVDRRAANECWPWTGNINHRHGYGELRYGRRGGVVRWRAHRLSYVLHKGEIPESLVVMHACDNRWCVNPSHLSIGTVADNVRDMFQKGRDAMSTRRRTVLARAALARTGGSK